MCNSLFDSSVIAQCLIPLTLLLGTNWHRRRIWRYADNQVLCCWTVALYLSGL